jgi:hypothetical protein
VGYDADWSGTITITPPLTYAEIRNAPKLSDLELDRAEQIVDTDSGRHTTITGHALQPKTSWGAYGGYNIGAEIRMYVEAFPNHEFAGCITADGPEGNHWRYLMRGRDVVYQTPELVWHDADE